VEND
jgi:hypothetical protein